MKKTRFTEAQMVTILAGGRCQADPGGGEEAWSRAGHDLRLAEALRRLEPTDVQRLRQLEQENGRLKRLVADLTLDLDVLKEVSRKKW